MAISNSLQSTLNGNARTAGEFFHSEAEAADAKTALIADGKRNVRISKSLSHTTRKGIKVYVWVVRCDA